MSQEIRFCVTQDGVRLAYAKVGQGPALVRVGTWLTHLEHDWKSPVWRPWLDSLSHLHTLYRYDPRGCGLSDWNVAHFSANTLLSDLETIVDAAGLEQFALIGMSQGGCIAANYAARHPERVTHLVIYGGYLRGMAQRNPGATEAEEIELFPKLIKLAWTTDNPIYKQVLSTELMPEGTLEHLGWLNDLQRVSTSADNAMKLQQLYCEINSLEIATGVRCPTLILHAKHDIAVPFEEGRLIATHIPDARLVPLDSKNHILLPSELAWHQFWQAYDQFFGVAESRYQKGFYAQASLVPRDLLTQLTLREREILHLLAKGQRNDEIARTLVITSKTVRNYISHIYEKLKVSSRGEAVVWAREAGFDKHQ